VTQSYDLKEIKTGFDRDGYVVIRGFLSATELAELNRELERYITERVPQLPRTDVYYEDRSDPATLKQLARIKQHDAYFAGLIDRPKWTGVAEALLVDKIVAQELEWFNKPPRIGKFTPPHQDGYYFMLEPNEAVTLWLALDPVDESNGCVRYLPGSHRKGLRPHARTHVLGFSQGISDYSDADRQAEAPMVAQPGDLLVHHAVTVHRADSNSSQRHRRSLGMIFYAARARQDVGKLTDYQKGLNAELEAAKKI
jgi:phytanoyl-CoA hydroxylase